MTNNNYMNVEDLDVYNKLCRLHIDVCDLTHKWPSEEKYELGSQVMNRAIRAGRNLTPDTRHQIAMANLANNRRDLHPRFNYFGANMRTILRRAIFPCGISYDLLSTRRRSSAYKRMHSA